MIQCKEYHLTKLGKKNYLLPYGQEVSNLKYALELNETGVFLWKGLRKGLNKEQLLQKVLSEYELSESDYEMVGENIDQFIKELKTNHYIEEITEKETEKYEVHYLKIGPFCIAFKGSEKFLKNYFRDFICHKSEANRIDQTITFYNKGKLQKEEAFSLVEREDVIIREAKKYYIFEFPLVEGFYQMKIEKNGRMVEIYSEKNIDEESLFHILRFCFLVLSQQKGCVIIHSASVLYKEKAWLFSGVSGEGKSTHTRLWQQEFDSTLLNGDLNMLGIEENRVMVYGIPWCGTSKIYTKDKYELGGIVFLKKSPEDKCVMLQESEFQLSMLQRVISPAWTEKQLERNVESTNEIVVRSRGFRLYCTKNKSAVYEVRRVIENKE